MIGQTRSNTSLAESLRTPYASPQPTATFRLPADVNTPQPLVPFVPREFRDQARRAVTIVPTAEQTSFAQAAGVPVSDTSTDWQIDEVANHFGATVEAEQEELTNSAPDTSAFEAEDTTIPTNEVGADLPWIDAFAEDELESEETWPLGEAGKRLDELTESLSSLDASRARRDASNMGRSAESAFPAEPALPMWNEDEWIDIMPTSSLTPPDAAANEPIAETISAHFATDDSSRAPGAAELTARALESLAQRVRSGEVQVPEAQPDVAEEALLARVLAAMLGWRQ